MQAPRFAFDVGGRMLHLRFCRAGASPAASARRSRPLDENGSVFTITCFNGAPQQLGSRGKSTLNSGDVLPIRSNFHDRFVRVTALQQLICLELQAAQSDFLRKLRHLFNNLHSLLIIENVCRTQKGRAYARPLLSRKNYASTGSPEVGSLRGTISRSARQPSGWPARRLWLSSRMSLFAPFFGGWYIKRSTGLPSRRCS